MPLDSDSVPRVRGAFPSALAAELDGVLLILPQSTHPTARNDIGLIYLGGEQLRIPFRLYLPPPDPGAVEGLSPTQRVALSCIYTRHHDGYVREAALRAIISATADWIPPFVIQLVGEYVIEIVQIVLANMEHLATPAFRRFVVENPAFLATTRRRAISYWSCYHRRTAIRKEDYAGIRILDELARLGRT